MKKLIIIAFAVLLTWPAFSQKVKFGHVDYSAISMQIPGIDTTQQILLNLQQELQETAQKMADEFKTKEAEYTKLANSGASAALLKVKEDELKKLYAKLQDFAETSETQLQERKIELFKPFQEKLKAAIEKVSAKGGYTYVFDISLLAYFSDSDDLTEAVKAELGIK